MIARGRRIRRRRGGGLASPSLKAFELSLAAPAVIAMRTARMLAAGPHPRPADRRELARMGTEKMHAFAASFAAMAAQAGRVQTETWLAFARYWWSAWSTPWWLAPASGGLAKRRQRALTQRLTSTTAAMLDHGLAPLHRTAMANARRLSRR